MVMRLPPGLYKGRYDFYYQVVNTEHSWYELNPLYPESWHECWMVALSTLTPSSLLEFVLLTGKVFDPTELEGAYARRVAHRAARKINRRSKK